MKASTERQVIRWLHIIFSIPIVVFIYGPVSEIENAAFVVRWVFFPTIAISGLWLWKGYIVKRWFRALVGVPARSDSSKSVDLSAQVTNER